MNPESCPSSEAEVLGEQIGELEEQKLEAQERLEGEMDTRIEAQQTEDGRIKEIHGLEKEIAEKRGELQEKMDQQ